MCRLKAAVFLIASVALLWIGCDNARSCTSDDDCFAGESCLDQVCVPESGNNGGGDDAGGDVGASDDSGTADSDDNADSTGDEDTGGGDTGGGDTGTTEPKPIDVEAGEKISCALFDNGEVYCWGFNEDGLLNTGSSLAETPYPDLVNDLPAAQAIELGNTTACALTRDGEVYCWGENWGFVSGEDDRKILAPTSAPFSGVAQLSMGATGGCALLEDRQTLICWGNVPAPPDFENDIVDFSAGSFHGCAAVEGGDVRCWGSSTSDQVGIDDPIRGVSDVISLDAARRYNCAVKSDGSVWCWGDNLYGNLGDEGQSDTAEPVQVPSIDSAVDISTGSKYACAVLDAGGVKCWGEFRESDGAYAQFHPPTSMYPLVSGVVEVDTGDETSCALKSDGEIWCWGDNNYEQLGNSELSTTSKGEPARVLFD